MRNSACCGLKRVSMDVDLFPLPKRICQIDHPALLRRTFNGSAAFKTHTYTEPAPVAHLHSLELHPVNDRAFPALFLGNGSAPIDKLFDYALPREHLNNLVGVVQKSHQHVLAALAHCRLF